MPRLSELLGNLMTSIARYKLNLIKLMKSFMKRGVLLLLFLNVCTTKREKHFCLIEQLHQLTNYLKLIHKCSKYHRISAINPRGKKGHE